MTDDRETTYREGLAVKRRLFGAGKERPLPLGHLADDLLRLSDEVVFGRVYTRPGLDLKTRSMLTVAALTVLGRDDYLRRHLQGALHVGVTPEEIKEILMQMAFYGGIPCALKGLRIAHEEIAVWREAAPAPTASLAGPAAPPGAEAMEYGDYRHLRFDREADGVLLVTLDRPEALNAANERLHLELGQVWLTIDADPETRVALVTGAGRAFSAGGDLDLVERMARDPQVRDRAMREAADIVYNMINLDKPIVSAINGVAVGAGLVVALLADVSVMAETARFTDGHTRLGVVAGDHAAIVWPLLCGMAKAKYYLLTSDFVDGREAERLGLVSLCVPADRLMATARDVASRLGRGSQPAIRWTKRALNNWLRQAGPIFDQSLALEMLSFSEPDVLEGVRAIREKRAPRFPSASEY